MSCNHVPAGLPLGRWPSMHPCITIFSKRSPERRITCPKYLSLRYITDLSGLQSTFSSCSILSLVLLVVQWTRSIHLYVVISKAVIFWRSVFRSVQLLLPCVATGQTNAHKSWSFVFNAVCRLLHIFFKLAVTHCAFCSRFWISRSHPPLQVRMEPRYVNSDTCSSCLPSTVILILELLVVNSCVFLMFIMRP